MRTFLIDYDLNAPGKDYTKLIEHLKSYGNWCHYLKSGWLIRTESTADAVRKSLLGFVDANDAFIVVDVTGDAAAWRGLSDEKSKWIGATL
jgi:hypothetical protein